MHRSTVPSRRLLAATIAISLAAPAALAQVRPAAAPAGGGAPKDAVALDALIVTGTPQAQTKMESSVSISTIGTEAIEQSAPRSTAEIFRNIPGVRSESTGGEGNANIAVRGLPVAAGGAKFVQLHEDGLPVLEFGDIAFGNADIFLRADWSIDRIEALRGGSASTLASNSPGGIINFVSNTGEVEGGSVGLTAGLDYASFRTDFRYGGRLGANWRFHVAGFYRQGDGVRDPGYTAEKGGQVKANLTREFDGGYLRFNFKRLNDRAIGYLPMPVRVTGTNRNPSFSGFPGFDPGRDTPHSRFFLRDIGLDGNNGRRTTDIADGMHPDSTALGFEFNRSFGDGWSIDNRFRYASTSGRFVSPFPAEVASAASLAGSIGGTGSTLVFANGPTPNAAYTGLAIRQHLFNTEINDFGNYANNLQLSRSLDTADGTLGISAGWYRARQDIDMDWVWNSYVQQLGGARALLDVVGPTGTRLSTNGLYAYGVPFWGNCCTRSYNTKYVIDAPYLAANWESGPLRIDASVRRDSGTATGNYAGSRQVANLDVNGNGTIEPNERSVSTVDNARVSPVDYDWGYTSWSLGGNYQVHEDLAVFARASRGGRANADRLLFGVVRPNGSVAAQDAVDQVDQYEAGIKAELANGVSLFATAFRAETEEQNFEATNQRFLNRTYRASGLELEAAWRHGPWALNGGATWTNAEIVRDQISPANVGNTPRRQADWVYQATGAYNADAWTAGVNVIGTTDSYAQDNNVLVMPGFVQTNLFADWRMTDDLTVSLAINNVFDTFGITESEEGAIVDNGTTIIRARSIPGRSSSVSLRYDF